MIDLCFHYDIRFRDFWDQIVRTYKARTAYEVGTPEDVDIGPWTGINSLSEIDMCPRIFFSPSDARHMPGTISLDDFEHPEEAIYCFGSDNENSPIVECEQAVYIATPDPAPLWSVQAAGIVLQDRFRRGYN